MLIGTRTLSVGPKFMRLRHAVTEIPAKTSVPPGLPLNKNRSLLTPSESTLPQPLISLHFNSFRCNVYKNPGEGHAFRAPKFRKSSLPACLSWAHARISATPIYSYIYFITRGHPGVGGYALPVGQPNSSPSRGFRAMNLGCPFSQRPEDHRSPITGHGTLITEHESRNTGHIPMVPRYRCAATRKVPESRQLFML
jgi:hypothetical protein